MTPERWQEWYGANKELRAASNAQYRLAHPERMRTARKQWRDVNRARLNSLDRARDARMLGQTCTCCTKEKFQAIYDIAHSFGDEVDHIKPLALGGLHCRHNLQLLSPEQHRIKTANDLRDIRRLHE